MWGGGACAAAAANLLTVAILGSTRPMDAVALVCAAGVVGLIGGMLLWRRYRPADLEVQLRQRERQEKALARRLDGLVGLGWVVLHDRLLPGGEARVPHLLIGPGGVVVATPIPFDGPPFVVGDLLYTGSRPLTRWFATFATRWWEATWLNDRLSEAVEDFTWDGPTYPLAVSIRPQAPVRGAVPFFSRPPLGEWPPVWADVTVRTEHTAPLWVGEIPAPLPREFAAQLAAKVEELCPPARQS